MMCILCMARTHDRWCCCMGIVRMSPFHMGASRSGTLAFCQVRRARPQRCRNHKWGKAGTLCHASPSMAQTGMFRSHISCIASTHDCSPPRTWKTRTRWIHTPGSPHTCSCCLGCISLGDIACPSTPHMLDSRDLRAWSTNSPRTCFLCTVCSRDTACLRTWCNSGNCIDFLGMTSTAGTHDCATLCRQSSRTEYQSNLCSSGTPCQALHRKPRPGTGCWSTRCKVCRCDRARGCSPVTHTHPRGRRDCTPSKPCCWSWYTT